MLLVFLATMIEIFIKNIYLEKKNEIFLLKVLKDNSLEKHNQLNILQKRKKNQNAEY